MDYMDIAKRVRDILLAYYPSDHRFVNGVDNLLAQKSVESKEFSEAVGRLGWSGMGSFLDQVFCDLPRGRYELNELKKAEFEMYELLFVLGTHALRVDPNTPNHLAIKSMLGIWEDLLNK